jgi:hypothetical protein
VNLFIMQFPVSYSNLLPLSCEQALQCSLPLHTRHIFNLKGAKQCFTLARFDVLRRDSGVTPCSLIDTYKITL